MATTDQISQLRILIAEPTADNYSDEVLGAAIDAAGNVKGAAADIWLGKAAQSAGLVNVSESGSSRSLSDLHKNALAMAKQLGAEEEESVSDATGIRIRRITRR
jgi:hypothetical protein